jgi:hypothetical protein
MRCKRFREGKPKGHDPQPSWLRASGLANGCRGPTLKGFTIGRAADEAGTAMVTCLIVFAGRLVRIHPMTAGSIPEMVEVDG